jgi:hypothetical protein
MRRSGWFVAEYFQTFFIEGNRAPSYIPTIVIQVLAMVLLLGATPKQKKDYALILVDWLGGCVVVFLMTAAYYSRFGTYNMDFYSMIVLTVLYSLFRSKHPPMKRIVMASMYLACAISSYPLSAPWGELLYGVNPSYWSWGSYLTLVVMITMTAAEVWFLKKFTLTEESFIPTQQAIIQAIVSATIVVIECIYGIEGPYGVEDKPIFYFNVVVATVLWAIDLLLYYMLYNISKSNDEKVNLLGTQHKIRMEQEKYEANRVNYEELRAMRHELKNYTCYVKALLDAGRTEELSEFLSETTASKSAILNSYDSGNYIVDVITNHEMTVAKEHGVTLVPEIVVPHQLPYNDEDLCSLLANLIDNGIEAAAVSGQASPKVTFTMRPKQEYLFIHEENPVNSDVPTEFRLSLKTTKKSHELHGYGTKVIRRIVEKYHGSIKYAMRDGMFITDVMLELHEEEGT